MANASLLCDNILRNCK